MERFLGAALEPSEVVHHRDKRRQNNAIENLLLCPDQDIHLRIHSAMAQRHSELLHAYEVWLLERAANRRGTAAPQAAAPYQNTEAAPAPSRSAAEQSPTGAAETEALLGVIDEIKAMPNKADRAAFLSSVLQTVNRRRLLELMAQRIEGGDPKAGARLTWAIRLLQIDEAGPVLVRILESPTKEDRRMAWSGLRSRVYPALDTTRLAELALRERGQPLEYAVGAIALQCSPEHCEQVLQGIRGHCGAPVPTSPPRRRHPTRPNGRSPEALRLSGASGPASDADRARRETATGSRDGVRGAHRCSVRRRDHRRTARTSRSGPFSPPKGPRSSWARTV